MATSGANPLKAIEDHLQGYIEELEAELKQTMARAWVIQQELGKARLCQLVAPPEPKEGK